MYIMNIYISVKISQYLILIILLGLYIRTYSTNNTNFILKIEDESAFRNE